MVINNECLVIKSMKFRKNNFFILKIVFFARNLT